MLVRHLQVAHMRVGGILGSGAGNIMTVHEQWHLDLLCPGSSVLPDGAPKE